MLTVRQLNCGSLQVLFFETLRARSFDLGFTALGLVAERAGVSESYNSVSLDDSFSGSLFESM